MKVKCPGEFEKECGLVVEAVVRDLKDDVYKLEAHSKINGCRRLYEFGDRLNIVEE